MSCAICHVRKGKRFCPAGHDRICPQCCGEQRELTLDCPSDCVYLQQARRREAPPSLDELPPEQTFRSVAVPEEFLHDHEPLLLGFWHTLAKRYATEHSVTDREVLGALANMARSYQTLVGSGLVYQEAVPGLAQQAIIESLHQLVREFREVEQKHLGYVRLKDAEVLKALVFTIRMGLMRTSGRPFSRRFLDFLNEQFHDAELALAKPDDPAGRIIMP